jgi:Ca-activated chloride channel family protein
MSAKLARLLWIPAAAAVAAGGCTQKAPEQSSSPVAKQVSGSTGEQLPASEESEVPSDQPDLHASDKLAVLKKDRDEAAAGVAANQTGAETPEPTPPREAVEFGKKEKVPAKPAGPPKGALGGAQSLRAADASRATNGHRRGRGVIAAMEHRPMTVAQGSPTPESGESYQDYGTNPMTRTAEDRLSTFSVDVDTASYAIARRKIVEGTVPPSAAVRVEEFVNYFHYNYAGPTNGAPFAVHMDAAPSPFTPNRELLRIGVQGKKLSVRERKPAHLVFLVDVSGSMQSPDKLDLAKRSLRILVDNLKDGDTVALVTYADGSRVVLEPTGLEHKAEIVSAIEDLTAGGSTAMGSGITLAYELAARNLKPDAISRVIVLSDGDANVGTSSHEEILRSIASKVKEGVTLSTVGFGMGNYKDTMMEQLANRGNGTNYYIDSLSEAKRVFQEQLGGTLEVIAKDVKIQVDFDPAVVESYRLIGYENRDIADQDFRNDKVDAGEIGAGHTVTALYEVVLTKATSGPLATVRIRAKAPNGTKATETSYTFGRESLAKTFDEASGDFRFAAAVAATAEILRRSPYAAEWSLEKVAAIASKAADKQNAERQEFLQLLARLKPLRSQLTAAR